MTHIHKVQRQPGNRVVVASPGPQGPSGGGTGGGGVGVNVTDYGAIGNGQSDDTDPIAAAIVAAGVGGTVFFPQGSYRISRPIKPLQGQRLEGTYQSRYHAGLADPTSTTLGSMIAALPEFTGEALIVADEALEPRGVHLTRLAIVGPGETHASGCHGVKNDGGYGESSWWIEECLINSMPGHGITGHWWVFDMRDTHVSRCSWALKLTGSDGMLDTRIIGCMFYFNRDGGIGLDGGWTGLIEFIGCRVERSGNKYGYPFEPVNPNAPGILITSAHQCVFTNVSTDANTGSAVHMARREGTSTYLYNMEFQGCHFLRDGGGTKAWQDTTWWSWEGGIHQVFDVEQGVAPPDGVFPVANNGLSGIYLGPGVTQCSFVNCSVGPGPHTDWAVVPPWGGDPILDGFGPQYGITAIDTLNVTITNCQIQSPTGDAEAVMIDDSNWNMDFTNLQHLRKSVPVFWTEDNLPTEGVATGRVGYLANKRSLAVAGYDGEWHLIPAPSADAPANFERFINVKSDGSTGAAVRFFHSDNNIWQVGHNPDIYNNTFFVLRYDKTTGEFIDDPFAIDYNTGRVNLRHTYIESKEPDSPTVGVQGALDQTTHLTEWRNRTTVDGYSTVAGVRSDGRVWGQPAETGSDFVTLDQLSSGGGDVEFAQYTGSETRDKHIEFRTRDSVTGEVTLLWQMGVNPQANGDTFYVWRADATGAYLDSPIAINRASGRVDLNWAMVTNDLDPANTVLYIRSTDPLQSGPLIDADVDGVTMFQVSATGQVTAAEGTDDDHLVTKAQMDSALTGGGDSPSLTLDGDATTEKRIAFETDGLLRWQMGVNPANAFYIWRADDNGDYFDSVLTVNPDNGALSTNYQYIETNNPAAVPLQLVGALDQAAAMLVIKDSVGGLLAGVSADGRVWGSDGIDAEDYVTKSQLDAAVSGGTSAGLGPLVSITGSETQDKAFQFVTKDSVTEVETLQWQMGVNPSGTFYIWRPDALGNYLDTPLAINSATGRLTTLSQYIDATDPATTPFTVNAAASPTAPVFRVENSSGGALLEVTADSRVRSRWGSTTFGAVQQGCTQIVREGVAPGNTLLACYTSTANATADISVFEVYGNGSVKIGDATEANEAISLGQLQSVVAASSSWDDFKTRVAAL